MPGGGLTEVRTLAMRMDEKLATVIGCVLGGGGTLALVWEGARLYSFSDPLTYLVVAGSALFGSFLGGVIGDWSYNTDWARPP